MHAHPQHLARNTVGNLVERIELASTALPGVVGAAIDTIVKLASVTLMMTLVLSSVSTAIALFAGTWLLSAVLLSSYLAYTGMKIVEDASDAHARVIADLAEIITNVPLIRSATTQSYERSRFGNALRRDLQACRRARSYWVFVLLLESAYKWLFGIVLTVYIATQYGTGDLSLPQIVTVGSLIIALSWNFESVAFNFVDLFESLGVLRASLADLSNVPVDLETPTDGVPLPRPGQITLRDCIVNYGASRALHNINLQIKAGSKVGIVGPSGSGKSTLVGLLRGELQPESGEISIHGLPLSRHSPATLAAACTEASQSALMFNRSVRDNVAYGANATLEPGSINDALCLAQALDLVKELPQGLDTIVGERGSMISTGQRQRLSIARALLNAAPLVIFDEATSSVDAVSEAAIITHLVKGLIDRTVIVVSHRVATLSGFDFVVVMNEGRIVDVGRPCDLAKRCALYRSLLRANDATESPSMNTLTLHS
jgi:ATP-binding cassette subfamily B protein